jgi:hypothetical protein
VTDLSLAAAHDARYGWPLCECGHPFSLHDNGGNECRRVECIPGRCTWYRPVTRIDPHSPAAFAEAVAGFARHYLPANGAGYDRDVAVGCVRSTVAQLARQWVGWSEVPPGRAASPDPDTCGAVDKSGRVCLEDVGVDTCGRPLPCPRHPAPTIPERTDS